MIPELSVHHLALEHFPQLRFLGLTSSSPWVFEKSWTHRFHRHSVTQRCWLLFERKCVLSRTKKKKIHLSIRMGSLFRPWHFGGQHLPWPVKNTAVSLLTVNKRLIFQCATVHVVIHALVQIFNANSEYLSYSNSGFVFMLLSRSLPSRKASNVHKGGRRRWEEWKRTSVLEASSFQSLRAVLRKKGWWVPFDGRECEERGSFSPSKRWAAEW